jgi:hypothetical protein
LILIFRDIPIAHNHNFKNSYLNLMSIYAYDKFGSPNLLHHKKLALIRNIQYGILTFACPPRI